MTDSTEDSQIKTEIQRIDKLLGGLHYYLQNAGFLNDDKKITEYSDQLYVLDVDAYRASEGDRKVLQELESLLKNFRERMLVLGVSEADISDEKLLGYDLMQYIEIEQEDKEVMKMGREGKTPEQIIMESLTKRTIH